MALILTLVLLQNYQNLSIWLFFQLENIINWFIYLGRAVKGKILTHGKDNICGRGKKISPQTKKFSDYSFNPVASDRLFCPMDADAESACLQIVSQTNQTVIVAAKSFTIPVNLLKFIWFAQQISFGQGEISVFSFPWFYFLVMQIRRTDVCGPWPDGGWLSPGPPWFSFWPESHGCGCVLSCWVEKFFYS